MNDHPNAAELLAIARTALLEDILPGVPQERRYTALMIANAMAIAAREHLQSESYERAELARLGDLLKTNPEALSCAELHGALVECNRRLCIEIREGRFDGIRRSDLLGHLKKTADDKLKIANPKALDY